MIISTEGLTNNYSNLVINFYKSYPFVTNNTNCETIVIIVSDHNPPLEFVIVM